jgi:hypothetical protein
MMGFLKRGDAHDMVGHKNRRQVAREPKDLEGWWAREMY